MDEYWFSKGQLDYKYRNINIEEINYMKIISEMEPYLETFYNDFSQYCNNYFLDKENKNRDFPFLRSFICPNHFLYQDKFNFGKYNHNLLNQIVHDTRELLWLNRQNRNDNNIYTQGLCVYTSLHMISRMKNLDGIDAYLIHTNKTLGIPSNFHAFVFVALENKNYIIDCTYSQFLSLYYSSLDTLKVLPCLNAMPGYFLTTDDKKQGILNQILDKGWFEATEENMKMYLDSFVLASRNAYYYLNHEEENMIDTKINGSFYLSIIESFIDYTKKKNMDVDTYFDIHYAKEKKISYGNIEELTYKMEGLTKKQANDINQNIKENKMLIKTRDKNRILVEKNIHK